MTHHPFLGGAGISVAARLSSPARADEGDYPHDDGASNGQINCHKAATGDKAADGADQASF